MPKKYMKHYNFFLLMKKKNGLIKDKVGIEDIEIRIIKWEKVWNDNRRERERERDDICYKYKSNWIVKDYCNFKSKEYITVDIVKENSWPQFFFFFGYNF